MGEVVETSAQSMNNITFDLLTNKPFDAKEVADDILRNGDPITYILDTFNTIHIGDRAAAEVLAISLGATCVENCNGLHPKLSGESGKGKSHCCKTMIHLMPTECVLNTSLSAKSVFYNNGTMHDGMILFSDDIELSSELESIIKRSTSEFQQGIEHQTVDINRKGKSLRMPKRIAWWLASVDNDFDIQTLNRQISVTIDDSPETDKLVKEQQLRAASTGEPEYPETLEVQVCREIYRSIKKLFTKVVIPFDKRIDWRGESNRRNLPIFLDMVKVYALFNYRQREIEEVNKGKFKINANELDFERAKELYLGRAEMQTNKLTVNEMKIIDFLAAYGIADINQISEATGLMHNTTQRLLLGRKDRSTGGLLSKVKELRVSNITREYDGGRVALKEFELVGYNRLSSYGSIVSLTA